MSANRLIANQRLTAAIASLFNTMPFLQPILKNWTVDAVENEDDAATQTVGLKHETNVLVFNRHWIAEQEDSDLRGALFHLALGVMMDHVGRRGDRDLRIWNIATAYITNALIQQEIEKSIYPQGYITLPKGTLIDPRFGPQHTSEEAYEVLKTEFITLDPPTLKMPPEMLDEIRQEISDNKGV